MKKFITSLIVATSMLPANPQTPEQQNSSNKIELGTRTGDSLHEIFQQQPENISNNVDKNPEISDKMREKLKNLINIFLAILMTSIPRYARMTYYKNKLKKTEDKNEKTLKTLLSERGKQVMLIAKKISEKTNPEELFNKIQKAVNSILNIVCIEHDKYYLKDNYHTLEKLKENLEKMDDNLRNIIDNLQNTKNSNGIPLKTNEERNNVIECAKLFDDFSRNLDTFMIDLDKLDSNLVGMIRNITSLIEENLEKLGISKKFINNLSNNDNQKE